MSVADWNTDPALNTSVGGVVIGEGCPPSNLNNMGRQIMADAKVKFNSLDSAIGGAAVAALGSLTPAADRMAYYTSPTVAAMTPLTAFARSLIDDVDAPAMAATLGMARVGAYVPGPPGYISLLFGSLKLVLQWGLATIPGGSNVGEGSISFPVPFPTAPLVIIGNGDGQPNFVRKSLSVIFPNLTTTGSDFIADTGDGAQIIDYGHKIRWLAVGC